jgi:hypothetical protein
MWLTTAATKRVLQNMRQSFTRDALSNPVEAAMATKIDDNDTTDTLNSFACPACGGREVAEELCISPSFDAAHSGDPWTFVLQRIRCADCGEMIPSHLGRRWKGLTHAQAQRQWREVFQPALETRWRGRGWDLYIAPSEAQGQRGRPRLPGQPYVSKRPLETLKDLRKAEILVNVDADALRLPQRPPADADYLGRVEWARSPMNNRVDAFWIKKPWKTKDIWVLWYGSPDDNSWDEDGWIYAVAAVGRQKSHDAVSAARTMVAARWVADLEELRHGSYLLIHDLDLFEETDFEQIASVVFGRPEDWLVEDADPQRK